MPRDQLTGLQWMVRLAARRSTAGGQVRLRRRGGGVATDVGGEEVGFDSDGSRLVSEPYDALLHISQRGYFDGNCHTFNGGPPPLYPHN